MMRRRASIINPSSPRRRCRFTHFDAVARDIPTLLLVLLGGAVFEGTASRAA
jgi:hypothetical protein